jgi:hypothetical protein
VTADTGELERVDSGISARGAAWLVCSVWAASLSLLALSLLMVILGWSTLLSGDWLWLEQATLVVVILGAPLLGGFVASSRSEPYGGRGWVSARA